MTSRDGSRQGRSDAGHGASPDSLEPEIHGAAGTGQEPIGRILASLDKLGARIRALAAEPGADAPAGLPVGTPQTRSAPIDQRASTTLDLKRAVEEIARKRDAIERRHEMDPPRVRASAERAAHVQGLLERAIERRAPPPHDPDSGLNEVRRELASLRRTVESGGNQDGGTGALLGVSSRLDKITEAVSDHRLVEPLRDELVALKQAVLSLDTQEPVRALEKTYDELVNRLDDLRGAVMRPEQLAEVLQRMTEVRSMLALAPTEAQLVAVSDRIEDLSRRMDVIADKADTTAIADLERHVVTIAQAISSLDATRIVEVVDSRLADLDAQIASLAKHMSDTEPLARVSDAVERHAGVLSQIAEASDQIPRVAVELERQAAGFEKLAKSVEAMPRLSKDVAAVRDAVIKDLEQSSRGYELLVQRLDEINTRVQSSPAGLDSALLGEIGDQFVEILRRLERLEGPPQEAIVAAIEDRFERLTRSVEERLKAPAKGALGELTGAVARIEQHIASDSAADRFAALEERISDIGRMLVERPASAPSDLAALEREIAQLGSQIDTLSRLPALGGVEAEIRSLANRIDTLSRPSADADMLDQLVQKLGDVMDRLDGPGPEMIVVADALERIERTLAAIPTGEDIAEAAARVATITYTEMDGREAVSAIAQVQRELDALQSDIRNASKRDRDLLVSISTTLERLVDSRPADPRPVVSAPEPELDIVSRMARSTAAVPPTPVAPAVHAPADAPAAKADHSRVADDAHAGDDLPPWTEALADVSPRLRPTAKPAEPAPEVMIDPISEIAARLRMPMEAPTVPNPEPKLGPAAALSTDGPADDTPALDLIDDQPLEPGSGKPTFGARAPVSSFPDPDDLAEPAIKGEPSKADFIAAARRAAQAVSAEMPAAKPKKSEKTRRSEKRSDSVVPADSSERGGKKSLFSGIFGPNKRKLMAAAAVVVMVGAAAGAIAIIGPQPLTDMASALWSEESTPAEALPPEMEVAAVGDGEIVDVDPTAAATETTASTPKPAEPVVAAAPPAAAVLPPVAETIPPAALPDAKSMTAEPLGPASSFSPPMAAEPASPAAETETAVLAPDAAPSAPESPPAPLTLSIPTPPEAIGPLALRQAASEGNAVAQFEIAARLTEGRGVDQDLAQAAIWYELAAQNGLAAAQYRLGSFYEKGQGLPRDLKAAARWYQAAADQGNVKAMHNIAVLNAEGGLGAPDYAKAADWFEKAANYGLRDSQYNLGILYARGLGVSRDLTASYKWFALAAQAGDPDAAKKRDDVAQTLEKDVLARARLAVETWSPKIEDPAANSVDTGNPAWVDGPDKTASLGVALSPILQAQMVLGKLGYDVGPADGKMGARTREAIMAFQRKNGLAPTGEADAALLLALGQARL
ncbi:peptidoglycan-binding protein [Chthonobacter albigriseus]|uniref:peptidoglycan-binding protein n=1 Tax=Chthonobacter albigriseus TaxID=1683161 RepID=UPI0015EEDC2E|nr:peptidoglycan-binding protein [Chthonobacter albigriseus]